MKTITTSVIIIVLIIAASILFSIRNHEQREVKQALDSLENSLIELQQMLNK